MNIKYEIEQLCKNKSKYHNETGKQPHCSKNLQLGMITSWFSLSFGWSTVILVMFLNTLWQKLTKVENYNYVQKYKICSTN